MATGPSISSVTCLNCIGFPLELWARIVCPRAVRVGDLCPIFDFLGGLVHGRDRNICPPSDFGGIAVYLMSKASSYHTADCFVIDGRRSSRPARRWAWTTRPSRSLLPEAARVRRMEKPALVAIR